MCTDVILTTYNILKNDSLNKWLRSIFHDYLNQMNLKRQYYCITMEAYASYGAMILIQFAYGGANILTKIALEKGLNQLVFVVYRHIIAMLLLGPFAYVLERLAILVSLSLSA